MKRVPIRRRRKTREVASEDLPVLETIGTVFTVPPEKKTILFRLTGEWAALWRKMKRAAPHLSDQELLRQGVALRAALLAKDLRGEKVRAYIEYFDGEKVVRDDFERHVGIKPKPEKSGN